MTDLAKAWSDAHWRATRPVRDDDTPSELFAQRNEAVEEMHRIECIYESGELESREKLALWAAMTARRLPPLTDEQVTQAAHLAREIDGQRDES